MMPDGLFLGHGQGGQAVPFRGFFGPLFRLVFGPALGLGLGLTGEDFRRVARYPRAVLLGLRDSAEGRRVLSGMETSRFIRAGDSDYAVVRTFMERFESHVRRVVIP